MVNFCLDVVWKLFFLETEIQSKTVFSPLRLSQKKIRCKLGLFVILFLPVKARGSEGNEGKTLQKEATKPEKHPQKGRV